MIPDCGDKGMKKKWNKLSGNRHEKWQENRQLSCRFSCQYTMQIILTQQVRVFLK